MNKKSKRICMVVEDYYPQDVRVRKEVAALRSEGYSVDVICIKKVDQSGKETIDGVRIYRLPLQKRRGNKLRYIFEYCYFFILSTLKLTFLNFKGKYDLIEVHTLPDILIFSTIIPKLFGSKVLLDLHEIMPEFFMSKFKATEKSAIIKLLKFLEKISVRYADKAITVNDRISKIIGERSKIKYDIPVIMNSVDEDLFKKRKHVQTEDYILSYHGTLTELYGVEKGIKAVSLLKEKIPEIKFNIFGNGSSIEELKNLSNELGLNDRVRFFGSIPFDEMSTELAKVDLGILPLEVDQLTENCCSTKLNEYIFLGIPVIMTKLRATLDYFDDKSIGYIEDNDPETLADKIYEVYQNRSLASELATNAYKSYKKINWGIMKNRYLSVITELLKDNHVNR